jgi:hypothetical protein
MYVGANFDDGSTFDVDALPCIIETLTVQEYRFVTLGQYFG